jgi:hypothetical protein
MKLKRHGSKAARTVILTSASLVRGHDDDKIDNTLKVLIICLGLLSYIFYD